MSEKAVTAEVKFEGTKLLASVQVDSNKDGQPMAKLSLEVELTEIPDEVFAAVKAAKA